MSVQLNVFLRKMSIRMFNTCFSVRQGQASDQQKAFVCVFILAVPVRQNTGHKSLMKDAGTGVLTYYGTSSHFPQQVLATNTFTLHILRFADYKNSLALVHPARNP